MLSLVSKGEKILWGKLLLLQHLSFPHLLFSFLISVVNGIGMLTRSHTLFVWFVLIPVCVCLPVADQCVGCQTKRKVGMPMTAWLWMKHQLYFVCVCSRVYIVICKCVKLAVISSHPIKHTSQRQTRPLLRSHTILTLPHLTKPLPLINILLLSDFRRVQRLRNTQQSLYSHAATGASVDVVFALISVEFCFTFFVKRQSTHSSFICDFVV